MFEAIWIVGFLRDTGTFVQYAPDGGFNTIQQCYAFAEGLVRSEVLSHATCLVR